MPIDHYRPGAPMINRDRSVPPPREYRAPFVVRVVRSSGFKLGVVVGTSRDRDMYKVCLWRNNSTQWTRPQWYAPEQLETVPFSAFERRALRNALRHLEHNLGELRVYDRSKRAIVHHFNVQALLNAWDGGSR
jgi:hypothetical protein